MLVRGEDLTAAQRRLVFAAFTYRWTHENAQQSYHGLCPACVQHGQCGGELLVQGIPWHDYHVPLRSDDAWLQCYAFHFAKDGTRLLSTPHWCEPLYRV